MPVEGNQSVLPHSSELLHINFRSMRQQIEHEFAHLSLVCASEDTSQDQLNEAVSRLNKLAQYVQETKAKHQKLVLMLKARLDYWERYQWELPAPLSIPETVSNDFNDLPLIVPVANYLAERGGFEDTVQQLIMTRPEIVPYLDLDAITEEQKLLKKFDQEDYTPILKWCKKHRSSIRKAEFRVSRVEMQIQIREYVRLALMNKPIEAIQFGRKAFLDSMKLPEEQRAIEEAAQLLYRGLALQPTINLPTRPSSGKGENEENDLVNNIHGDVSNDGPSDTPSDTPSDKASNGLVYQIPAEHTRVLLLEAIRVVYRRPLQNPLVSNVLLGAAGLKTRQCLPGSRSDKVVGSDEKVCPLCRSYRMQDLFDSVPFAQHGRSKTDSDLQMFPSGAVATHESILRFCERQHLPAGVCRDPRSGDAVLLKDLRTVYAL